MRKTFTEQVDTELANLWMAAEKFATSYNKDLDEPEARKAIQSLVNEEIIGENRNDGTYIQDVHQNSLRESQRTTLYQNTPNSGEGEG